MIGNSDLSTYIDYASDGSQTVYSTQFNQHYHSMHGAIAESEHVFIKEGLKRLKQEKVKVLEFGFGTGLNALLTLRDAIADDLYIDYIGIEKYPLAKEIWSALEFPIECPEDLKAALHAMHASPWESTCQIHPRFQLRKLQADMLNVRLDGDLDLVYFDAFGPGTQPELWSSDLFLKIYHAMAPGAIITTYSCKGDVRRAWMAMGLQVVKPIGPPGKRSMLVGIKA